MKRPQSFDEIIGNELNKSMLKEAVSSAKLQNESLGHIFLSGPSGCGKSTFAGAIATEVGSKFHHIMCKGCDEEAQLIVMNIMQATDGDIIFLDEVHNLSPKVMEGTLYDYLENNRVSIKYGSNVASIDTVPKVTIIVATTEMDKIPIPFINRFPMFIRLEKYNQTELTKIIQFNALSENITLNDECAGKIAEAARGTPRLAIQYLRRVKDHIISQHITTITPTTIAYALSLMGVDKYGLSPPERNYLIALYNIFQMKPAGVESVASVINENKTMLVTQYEPTMISSGLIIKTKSGRALTPKGIMIAADLFRTHPI